MGLYDQNQSLQDALRKLREGASHSRAAQEIAQRDYVKAQAEADKWERRYELALKEGREDLVSQAQFQKERYQAIASRLKNLVDEQTPQVDTIQRSLKSWEKKVYEAQNKENKTLHIEANLEDVSKVDDLILINLEDVGDELQRLKEEVLLSPQFQKQATELKDVKVLLTHAICQTKEALNTAFANKECIQKDYNKAQEEVKFWNRKAHVALKNNDDNLAIKAVIQKKIQNKIALTLQTQLQQQEATVAVLRENMMTLENLNKTKTSDTKL